MVHRRIASYRNLPNLRQALATQYAELPAARLDRIVQEMFGEDVTAEDLELSWGDVGSVAGTVAQKSLPVALPMLGTAVGGPLGGVAGAAVGQAVGGMIGGKPPAAAAPPPSPRPVPMAPAATAASSAPAVSSPQPALTAADASAATQLLALLRRPEMIQALHAMGLGAIGRPTVPVGQTPVPTAVFATLLSLLAGQAATQESARVVESMPDLPAYLEGRAGTPLADPANPIEGATALLGMLQRAEFAEYASRVRAETRQRAAPRRLITEVYVIQEDDIGWLAELDEDDESGDPFEFEDDAY